MGGRVILWFSCGDASAVAVTLGLRKYQDHECVVARIVIPSEHPDNDRFAADCSRWFGLPIVNLSSSDYTDTWDVWEKRRYISGIAGAPCTAYLKKAVRKEFQRHDDIHVFGYTAEETQRAERFRKTNFELAVDFPLIEANLRKPDCHAIVRAAGIELPAMYLLGFDNNNCIGCPKGGAGYWNMIRRHFPAQFERMSKLCRELGVRLVRQHGERIFLDELDPSTGRQKDEIAIDCSAFCEEAVDSLGLHPLPMTLEEIEEQTQSSDLYSPTIKRVMKKFSDGLKRRATDTKDSGRG